MKILPKKIIVGEIQIPASKSYGQRAIALASLSESPIVVRGLTNSDDVLAAQGIIEALGAEFTLVNNELKLAKGINLESKNLISINCKESGLSTRLFSAFSLLFPQDFVVNGEGSILSRTMEMVIDGLEEFGKDIKSEVLKLPLTISGELSNFNIEIDGSISSQFLTGLLIVAPFLNSSTEIKVANLRSKPYIEMTLDLMNHFGLEVAHDKFEIFKIQGNQKVRNLSEYTVEGDWSAASFHIVAAAIGGNISLKGLVENSCQGDKAILNAVQVAGAKVEWKNEVLFVQKQKVDSFVFDATECPDLFPPLAVLAAYAGGVSKIKGVNRLKHKESDRGVTLQKEFAKAGVRIELQGDEMLIYGEGQPKIIEETTFFSHNDHRIAMAMSLFSIGAKYAIIIDNPGAIDKSYPDFYKDFLTI